MTEDSADSYVRNKFGETHPDLVEIYLGLTGTDLVADLPILAPRFAGGSWDEPGPHF
jgi:hypothetical protein